MNQRRSLLGGGNSPAFSSADVALAAGMGITLLPSDVLAAKRAVVDEMLRPTEIMLSTLRGEVEARKIAEKHVVMLEDAVREHTDAFDRATAYLADRPAMLRRVERWKRLAFLSVPVLAVETALIIWMAWRIWAQ